MMFVGLIIALAILLGLIIGTITGLVPGIHINLVAFLLLSLIGLGFFYGISPIILVIFIVSISITHIFIDFIPTIFLGAPDEDSVLSILPGHELLLEGNGHQAVILAILGCLTGTIIAIPFTCLFIKFLPIVYSYASNIMFIILITASFFLIYFEKNSKKLAILIFLLAGFLGIASLNLNLKDPLLPLLTGLFGSSSLITSISKKENIPPQKITKLRNIGFPRKSFIKSSFASFIASPLCSFLPGLGSGQAAVIGSEVTGDLDRKEFLFLIGSINIIVMSLSFVTLYTIQKSRTGSAAAIQDLLTKFNFQDLLLIIFAIIITAFIAFLITINLSKISAKIINKINYSKLSISILIFLTLIILIFSGLLGLLVFVISTTLGLLCIKLNVRRTHLMGCLMLPTILFYLL